MPLSKAEMTALDERIEAAIGSFEHWPRQTSDGDPFASFL
jgi:hypothetical protein